MVSSPRVTSGVTGSAREICWPRSSSVTRAASAINGAGAADFPLQQHDAVEKRFGGRRAARNVDVDRHDAVATTHHGVGIVIVAAAIGAASHRDDVTRLRHLVVDLA